MITTEVTTFCDACGEVLKNPSGVSMYNTMSVKSLLIETHERERLLVDICQNCSSKILNQMTHFVYEETT